MKILKFLKKFKCKIFPKKKKIEIDYTGFFNKSSYN